MKNLFKGEIEKNNFLAEEFIIRNLSDELTNEADKIINKIETHNENAKLPTVLRLIKTLSFYAALILGIGIINGLLKSEENSLPMNKTTITLIVISIICLIVSIGLFIYEKIRFKNVENSQEVKDDIKRVDELFQECLDDLNIPKDHKKVDVIMTFYKIKNNKEIPAFNICENMVAEYMFFEENDHICFADTRCVIAFKKESITKLRKVEEKKSFVNWTKESLPNSPIYKEYGIKTNNYGVSTIRSYYVLELNINDEDYEIILPPYDIDEYLKVLNMEVENSSVDEN